MNLQPTLQDAKVRLLPLQATDFEPLYAAASDPLVWVEHPNPLRYQRAVFETYFAGALASGGAFRIERCDDGTVIGSTRYYDLDATAVVKIGYTFFRRDCWRLGFNPAVKKLMLDHAFQSVAQVLFQVGACNRRSIAAMQRLGAQQLAVESVAYHGETSQPNVIFSLTKAQWCR